MDKEDVVHIYNGILLSHEKERNRASLVEQWLRIHLPMQGTQVRALIPHVTEQLSLCATTTEPVL